MFPKVEPTIVEFATMSTNSKSTGRMSTREGGRDKIARVMERLRSGGIVEDGSNSKAPSNGNTPVVLASESTRSPTQKKAKNKTKPKKKTIRSLKETGKSSTSTGANAAAQSEVAARLAEIEDKYEKQHKAASSSHPRHGEGNGPGNHVL